MKRASVLAVILLSPLAAFADEAADAGVKFLATVAESWSKALPEDQAMGMYMGRKWIGKAVFTVKAAPPDSGAAFETSITTEVNIMGQSYKTIGHALLAKDLTPVSADSIDERPDGKTAKRLAVKDGRWTLQIETGTEKKAVEGKVTTNTSWAVKSLLLYAHPEAAEMVLIDPAGETQETRFKAVARGVTASLGTGPALCDVIGIEMGEQKAFWLYDNKEGHTLAMQIQGAPFHAEPCEAARAGKDLAQLPVPDAGKVVAALYLAIKKGDGDAAAALFDIQTMAREAGEDPESFQKGLVAGMVTEEAKNALPDASFVEDLFAEQMACEVEGDEATVQVGTATFTLRNTKDEDGGDVWLIHGVESH